MFSQSFLREIESLALRIALSQRGESHLQSIDVLYSKFQAEEKELAEAEEIWDELPDLGYYAGCMSVVDRLSQQSGLAQMRLGIALWSNDVSLQQLEDGTLAKYRLRVSQPKDIANERAAILAAVASL